MRTTTRNNQTLPDIALQECGNIEAAFDIARLNGLSLTDELKTGQTLDIACTTACTESVVGELAADGVKPATAPSAEEVEAAPYGGIGYMGIEIDFVVK